MIGILAGMGPRSTSPFLELVLNYSQKLYNAKLDEEFPKMLILSLPTPFYIDKPIDHQKMKKVIFSGLKQLEKNEVKFIAMPCNSAYLYYEELVNNINVPLLNIVDETLRNINDNSKTTILATKQTMESNLYQDGLSKKGIEYYFDLNWQNDIDAIINNIKMWNIEFSKYLWDELLSKIKGCGISKIITACTDLNLILTKNNGLEILDSSEELAKATVNNYLKYVG
jgi:amino-acid racemase